MSEIWNSRRNRTGTRAFMSFDTGFIAKDEEQATRRCSASPNKVKNRFPHRFAHRFKVVESTCDEHTKDITTAKGIDEEYNISYKVLAEVGFTRVRSTHKIHLLLLRLCLSIAPPSL
jgi:hypothetical protein